MADQKITDLILRLYRRTQDGKVPWVKAVEDETFQATFSKGFSIQIAPRPSVDPSEDEPDYWVTILNETGEVVEEFSNLSFPNTKLAGIYPWVMFRDIHTIARRTAMGAERAIDTIMAELGEDEPEDIPF
jgi:hypothetical protein